MGYRVKKSQQESYPGWVKSISDSIVNQVNQSREPFEKVLKDTVDAMSITLMDFQTAAWVIQNSENRDAFLGFQDLNFSSAMETMMTIALSALEKDIEGIFAQGMEEQEPESRGQFDWEDGDIDNMLNQNLGGRPDGSAKTLRQEPMTSWQNDQGNENPTYRVPQS